MASQSENREIINNESPSILSQYNLEHTTSRRNPRQLDFTTAMNDFRAMFPDLDESLIESILRSNGGAVDDTIDELLHMADNVKDTTDGALPPPCLPPKPSGTVKTTTGMAPVDNSPGLPPPPALPPREGSLKKKSKSGKVLYNIPKAIYDVEWNGMVIPLLGRLPADFLRITHEEPPPPRPPKTVQCRRSMSLNVQPHRDHHALDMNIRIAPGLPQPLHKNMHGHITKLHGERMSTNVIRRQLEENQKRIIATCEPNDIDSDTARFLEDERLALIMQNDEFLRELKRNEDFMRTLEFERDILANKLAHTQRRHHRFRADLGTHHWMEPRLSERDDLSVTESLSVLDSPDSTGPFSPTPDNVPATSQPTPERNDDHDFKDQLRGMGASSKKKFAVLAKKFFSTARRRRKGTKVLRTTHAPSTLNLLDDNDDEDLIDASSDTFDRDANVLFEPLPNNWTSGLDENKQDVSDGAKSL